MRKDFLRISLHNISRHWRKSLITGICITLGFTGIILLGGYMLRMERYLTTQGIYLNHVGHLAIYKKNGLERHLVEPLKYSFSPELQKKITDDITTQHEVERVGLFLHGQGLITSGCKTYPFLGWASDPETESFIRNHPLVVERIPLLTKIKRGSSFWDSNTAGIVITKRLAELLEKKTLSGDSDEVVSNKDFLITDCADSLSKKIIASHSGVQLVGASFDGGIATIDTDITGQFTTGFALSEDTSILMPLSLAQNFYGTENVTSLAIFLKDENETNKLKQWFLDRKKKWGEELDVYTYKDSKVNPFYVGAMRFVYIMNLFFFLIVCGVVVLSLLNAIQIAILERKAEIATFLSIGYRRSHVRHLFELESLIVAGLALCLGVILSYGIAFMVNMMKIQFDIVGNAEKLFLELHVEWWYCLSFGSFFLVLVYAATSIICRKYLNVPVIKLLERAD